MKKYIILWLWFAGIFESSIYPDCQVRGDTIVFDSINKKDYLNPVYQIFGINVIINRFDYHVMSKKWSNVSPSTWWINLNRSIMTDGDEFFTNWLGHPFHGSLAYNAARANALGFYESAPYVFGHSLLWEYFAETEPPSIIDFYTTTFGGIYLGELTYRLTDFAWNHPSKYKYGKWRTVMGGLINPVAAINRWALRKKLPATSQSLIPLELSLYTATNFRLDPYLQGKNILGQIIGVDIIYGENEASGHFSRPFDHFNFNSWVYFVRNHKTGIHNTFFNIQSDATIIGKNLYKSNETLSLELNQNYNFLHNDRYKLSTISVSGEMNYLKVINDLKLELSTHIGMIIYGSSNSDLVEPVSPEIFPRFYRDYIYGHGVHFDALCKINLKGQGQLGMSYNYYSIHSKDNPSGVKNIGLLLYKYELPIYRNMNLALNYEIYHSTSSFELTKEGKSDKNELYKEGNLMIKFYF